MDGSVWPLGSYAPGNYSCKCINCLADFIGDKRAINCLECASLGANSTIASLQERVKRLEDALRDIEDAANSFQDEEGYEVAGQIRLRVQAALKDSAS